MTHAAPLFQIDLAVSFDGQTESCGFGQDGYAFASFALAQKIATRIEAGGDGYGYATVVAANDAAERFLAAEFGQVGPFRPIAFDIDADIPF